MKYSKLIKIFSINQMEVNESDINKMHEVTVTNYINCDYDNVKSCKTQFTNFQTINELHDKKNNDMNVNIYKTYVNNKKLSNKIETDNKLN